MGTDEAARRSVQVSDSLQLADVARVSMRHYFSTYLLWSAEHNAVQAGSIEAAHDGPPRFDARHQSHVLDSILASAAFLEAAVNELYQDAYDGHGTSGDGYIAPLKPETRKLLAEVWRETDEGVRMRPLDKYQLLLASAGLEPLDRGEQPYQDARLVTQLRNTIAHFQPEDVSAEWPHKLGARLRGKFEENRLMAGAGNPWWPSHCLGAGCAAWAAAAAESLTAHVCAHLGIRPNYQRLREDGWSGFGEQP